MKEERNLKYGILHEAADKKNKSNDLCNEVAENKNDSWKEAINS